MGLIFSLLSLRSLRSLSSLSLSFRFSPFSGDVVGVVDDLLEVGRGRSTKMDVSEGSGMELSCGEPAAPPLLPSPLAPATAVPE
uniref:Putative secreted protein n=1 Tax=Anopheles triannulatus TaxID=58253 RepID=A0A2M4B4F0_9DIPT